ncbi:hypothetical protein [Sphingobium naphthae]|uniref:Flagellar hook-length control protein FliK n=1 Tax=Sphingobium naphthae TaxID=1886786 RepID=A0ABU3ZZ95_9SPHN|nr:hypothetical protein [Sphingobium naphthae]MDV5824802.1 hypothetical protein [Sphingobium naphthae]
MSAAIAPATPQPAALRAGIGTGTGPRADTAAKDAVGPEAAESFRSLLARKARNGGGEGKPMRKGKGAEEAAATPAPATAMPLALSAQTMGVTKHGSTPGPSDDKAGQALAPQPQRPGEAQGAPVATPYAGAAAQEAASAQMWAQRMDAGAPSSTSTHLSLPGDQWRAEHVRIDAQQGGLSVLIDLGADAQDRNAALQELEARLRARGLDATIQDGGAALR